jgi:uncharacterized protein (TIGR00255 family)
MTGFARVRTVLPEGELAISIKSVNHRGLDLHFHLPPDFDPLENSLRSLIKSHVARGHLQINVVFHRNPDAASSGLNKPLLDAWLAAFRRAAEEYQFESIPDLNAALRIPGMFQSDSSTEPGAELEKALLTSAGEALDLLNAFREREGAAIVGDICRRCATISGFVQEIEAIRARASEAFHSRLKERLEELLGAAGMDPQRLAQEAAILAERSDISEELVRLKIHASQIGEMLAAGGEIGKKLDFLLQEMNRETNTVLSKTSGLGELGLAITDLALASKSEIDKIREQSLNLE